jgi:hypothetical protein
MVTAFTVDYPGRINLLGFSPAGTRLASPNAGARGGAAAVVENNTILLWDVPGW